MATTIKEDFPFDVDLMLEDSLTSAGAVSAIVASQEGKILDVAKVIDLGDGLTEGYMIVDIDAILCSAADVLYNIKLQGTNTAAFAGTDIFDLAQVNLGAGELLANATAGQDMGAAGDRFVVPFRNELAGTFYRYVRVYTLIANGTGETITYNCWLTKTK